MMRNLNVVSGPVVHIRFRGVSRDVELSAVGITAMSQEPAIRRALARFLVVSEAELTGHVIERHGSGNVTLRPEAVFG